MQPWRYTLFRFGSHEVFDKSNIDFRPQTSGCKQAQSTDIDIASGCQSRADCRTEGMPHHNYFCEMELPDGGFHEAGDCIKVCNGFKRRGAMRRQVYSEQRLLPLASREKSAPVVMVGREAVQEHQWYAFTLAQPDGVQDGVPMRSA